MVDYDSYRLIKDVHEEKDKRREEAAKAALLKAQKAEEETSGADEASAHPLVKDKRFLKLSFFPDIVPDCFKECEE